MWEGSQLERVTKRRPAAQRPWYDDICQTTPDCTGAHRCRQAHDEKPGRYTGQVRDRQIQVVQTEGRWSS